MATRKDVAERAGVSVATVSYVLNGSKNVTPEVEKRVRKAVEELGYRPNLLARSLSMRQTRHVALLVDNLHNPHFCELLAGAQQVASENGYIVSVLAVDLSSPEDILSLPARGVDGVILSASGAGFSLREMLGPLLPIAPSEYLHVDFEPAMADMVDHLRAMGHRRFAFLSGNPLGEARFDAWQNALWARGLEIDPRRIVEGPGVTDEAEGFRAMGELLSREVPFTAVFTTNDLMALGAMRALSRAGLGVPKDVSVVGCDRLRVFQALTPTLSSMDMQSYEIGRRLMRLLIEEISGQPHEHSTIEVKFIPGESIGPARKSK